ncbi:MAG: hypothetical protein JW934_19090 [Anaerolineae bacterium]|nr:hypothetical protein [Anaerolineae bacterium]
MDTATPPDYYDRIRELLALDIPDIDKLCRFFDNVSGAIVAHAHREIELARAMGDDRAELKVKIKMSTMRHARSIFATGYQMIAGKEAWDDAARH